MLWKRIRIYDNRVDMAYNRNNPLSFWIHQRGRTSLTKERYALGDVAACGRNYSWLVISIGFSVLLYRYRGYSGEKKKAMIV